MRIYSAIFSQIRIARTFAIPAVERTGHFALAQASPVDTMEAMIRFCDQIGSAVCGAGIDAGIRPAIDATCCQSLKLQTRTSSAPGGKLEKNTMVNNSDWSYPDQCSF